MARKGDIEIPIAVDTGGTEKAIQNGLIDPIEDAEKALEALGKVDAGKDIDQDLKKAQNATEDLEDELDGARTELKKLGYAAKDAGDDGKQGLNKIKDGAQEVQNEIGSNMGEAFSSFRGNIEDVGQIGQDTLGGLAATAAGMGGAIGLGAAAGLGAVAAGVGVITDAFTKAGEAADDARDAAFDFAYSVDGALKAAGYSERVNQWTSDTEKFKQVRDLATGSGWDEVEVIDALASGGDKLKGLTDAYDLNNNSSGLAMGRALELDSILKGTAEGYLSGTEAAQLAAKANYDYASAVGVATGEVDDLGNAIVTLPDGKTMVIDAKTQKAYEDIDALERKKLTNKDAVVNVRVNDQTDAGLNLIVANINRRRAAIGVGVGTAGRRIE